LPREFAKSQLSKPAWSEHDIFDRTTRSDTFPRRPVRFARLSTTALRGRVFLVARVFVFPFSIFHRDFDNFVMYVIIMRSIRARDKVFFFSTPFRLRAHTSNRHSVQVHLDVIHVRDENLKTRKSTRLRKSLYVFLTPSLSIDRLSRSSAAVYAYTWLNRSMRRFEPFPRPYCMRAYAFRLGVGHPNGYGTECWIYTLIIRVRAPLRRCALRDIQPIKRIARISILQYRPPR
jgi:hypothetical protein